MLSNSIFFSLGCHYHQPQQPSSSRHQAYSLEISLRHHYRSRLSPSSRPHSRSRTSNDLHRHPIAPSTPPLQASHLISSKSFLSSRHLGCFFNYVFLYPKILLLVILALSYLFLIVEKIRS